MADQRLPIVNSDDGQWGTILNQYIEKEHYNTGSDDPNNGMHQMVTIRPGTATAGTAPLKFTSGTLLATPEDGTIEYLSNQFYIRGSDGLSVAGDVGIGTVSPDAKLHVSGGHALLDNNWFLQVKDNGGGINNALGMSSGNTLTMVSGSSGTSLLNSSQANSLVDISNSGATTFKNSSDSSAAFQVQDQASLAVLNVDTSNSGVTIQNQSSGSTALTVDGFGTGANIVDFKDEGTSAFRIADGGAATFGTAGSILGTIGLTGNTSGTVTVRPAAAAGTWTLTLPTNDGDAGEFLQTDGSGNTTWAAASGGSSDLTASFLLMGG